MGLRIDNSKGTVFYGMHFYPGVAQYQEPIEGRIFINENTIRQMDASFTGCPVFVRHVDTVEQDIDKLRGEADGWVVESFYNKADGKHWVKFIVVSERGEEAIKKGYKLSNCYSADKLGPGGIWNDVSFDKEVVEGRYEHLALVPVARYNESVVMTPEKYREYCADRELEVQRIHNSSEELKPMALQLFKRTKVENAADLENTLVLLPKSKKEFTIAQIVNAADEHEMQHGMAHPDHMVDMGEGVKMTVKDMCGKMKQMSEELKGFKEAKNDGDDTPEKPAPVAGGSVNNAEDKEDDKEVKNAEEELEEDKVAPEKELPKAEKPKNASEKAADAAAVTAAREAAKRVKNAGPHIVNETEPVNFAMDGVVRGKQKYGSGR